MQLQHLRCLCEIVKHGLSVTRAAEALRTSQPALSRQLAHVERELGVAVFVRSRRRLTDLTPAGRAVLATARRMLADAESLARIGRDFADEAAGTLTVATTHTQARYALPDVIKRFAVRYPQVRLTLRQGSPAEITQLVQSGAADVGIGSEAPGQSGELVALPCYEMHRIVLTPPRHPLLREKRLTLAALARYPIITYDYAFVGRSRLAQAFEARGLAPDIVLSAIDTDVIKAYVASGVGIAVVAGMAFDPARDRHLRALDASHLFKPNTICISVRRNAYLRGYVYDFIEMFAPQLPRDIVGRAVAGDLSAAPPVAPRAGGDPPRQALSRGHRARR